MVPHSVILKLTNTERDPHQVVDPTYWLVHSDGYHVDGPSGRIGTVCRIIEDSETLVVRTGILGNRCVVVPFGDIDRVEPWHARLTVRCDPQSRERASAVSHPTQSPAARVGGSELAEHFWHSVEATLFQDGISAIEHMVACEDSTQPWAGRNPRTSPLLEASNLVEHSTPAEACARCGIPITLRVSRHSVPCAP